MSSEGKKIVIVRKKRGGHHEEHGGAWKVAYADFVTAMMAFFLVMWIVGMDQGVKDLVEGYFSNPIGFKRSFSGGSNPTSAGIDPSNLDLRRAVLLTREFQRVEFQRAAGEIEGKMKEAGLAGQMGAAVEVVVTDQGLRIELMETGEGEVFFDKASAALKPALSSVISLIAPELQRLPNAVVVEGHTDALPFGRPGYSNWELSVDRANAARRELVSGGLEVSRVSEIRGYAERELKIPEDPYDARNRRISILLPYREEPVVEEFRAVADSALAGAPLPGSILAASRGGRP